MTDQLVQKNLKFLSMRRHCIIALHLCNHTLVFCYQSQDCHVGSFSIDRWKEQLHSPYEYDVYKSFFISQQFPLNTLTMRLWHSIEQQ
jgi:hypothetical protein